MVTVCVSLLVRWHPVAMPISSFWGIQLWYMLFWPVNPSSTDEQLAQKNFHEFHHMEVLFLRKSMYPCVNLHVKKRSTSQEGTKKGSVCSLPQRLRVSPWKEETLNQQPTSSLPSTYYLGEKDGWQVGIHTCLSPPSLVLSSLVSVRNLFCFPLSFSPVCTIHGLGYLTAVMNPRLPNLSLWQDMDSVSPYHRILPG